MTQSELKSTLEKLWEPHKNIRFQDRTPYHNEIANLLCMFMDDTYEMPEEEIAPIRKRVEALLK